MAAGNNLSTPVKTPNPKSAPRRCAASQSLPPDFRARFEAYNRLQAAAVAFGEKLPIPEIVALGGQSDGKSSLLEALLGFRFNIREVEMGTRRPLILQMVHDPSALEPRCRFQVNSHLNHRVLRWLHDSHIWGIQEFVAISCERGYLSCTSSPLILLDCFILMSFDRKY